MISILRPALPAGITDPRLRALLERSFASMHTPHGDLTDDTEWLVVEPGDTEEDIIREIGFSPLVEEIDGTRFGSPDFHPSWDHIAMHEGYYEAIWTFGSTFAYILFIPDVEGLLLALCREYAR